MSSLISSRIMTMTSSPRSKLMHKDWGYESGYIFFYCEKSKEMIKPDSFAFGVEYLNQISYKS